MGLSALRLINAEHVPRSARSKDHLQGLSIATLKNHCKHERRLIHIPVVARTQAPADAGECLPELIVICRRLHTARSPEHQLVAQNPLLAKATVVDRSRGSDATSSGGVAAMGAGQSVPAAGSPAPAAAPLAVLPEAQPPRKKVPYEKGYSQMDWVRLTRGPGDLSGRGDAPPRSGTSRWQS